MKYNFSINPSGSNFTYKQLKEMLATNMRFVSQATRHTFSEITETDRTRGDFRNRVLSFLPSTEFNKSTYLAVAAGGIRVNIERTRWLDYYDMRALLLHELLHNVGVHHTESLYSVMSVNKFRSIKNFSLLWRRDLIELGCNIGIVSVDEKLNIMIPAIWYQGKQWAVRLKNVKPQVWSVHHAYEADDAVELETRATLLPGDIISLDRISFLGTTYPYPVELAMNDREQFELK